MQIHRLVSSVLFVPVHFCVSSTKTRKMFTCLPPSMMEASFQSREVEESVHVKMWFQRNQCVLLATTPTFVLLISEIRCWNLIPLLEKAGSGGACLAGRPPICASSSALSRHVQAVVHSGPLLTVIWWSHSTMQTRSFSVVDPKTWNGLPVDIRHLPNGACSQFHHLLNTALFCLALVVSASE